MNILNIFLLLEKEQIFSNIDIQFAIFINSFYKKNLFLIILSLYLSKNTRNGNISLSLKEFFSLIYKEKKNNFIINKICKKINFKNKKYIFLDSSYLLFFNKVIINPKNNDFKPIILYKNSLFLYNVWYSVNKLKKFLINAANYDHGYKLLIQQNKKKINYLFNNIHKKEKYKLSIQQKHTILITLKKKITIITGSAGTGKTSLIKQIIKAIKMIYNKKNLLIYLVAPTGKATVRLINLLYSFYKKKKKLKNILINIENISTLHKRLQSFNKKTQFLEQYNKKLDLLIIDEASMVNLELLYKVMNTILFSKTKLILIGDHYQLNAVDSIGILRPIINWNKLLYKKIWLYKNKKKINFKKKDISINLSKNIVILTNIYRFKKNSGIALLAKAIKENNFLLIKKIYFQQHKFFDICWYSWKNQNLYKLLINNCINYCKFIIKNINKFQKKNKINFLSRYLNNFQILCLLNKGKVGTDYINNIIEYNLFTKNFWYNGKPIIILKNDKDLLLSNGEIGITIFNKLLGEWEVMFLSYNYGLNIKTVKLKDIKYFKTAWSITIHKAQGSEFKKVLFILPDVCKINGFNNIQKILSLITKELIYTAITRAKKKITIFASLDTFLWGVKNQ